MTLCAGSHFHTAYNAVVEHVAQRYGVAVEVADRERPFRGDLDG